MKKILKIVIALLAILGVAFIILMFIPEEEPETQTSEELLTETDTDITDEEIDGTGDETAVEPDEAAQEPEEINEAEATDDAEENAVTDDAEENAVTSDSGENVVTVDIPDEEKGDAISFTTMTLDDSEVTQDIFRDYDITVVHVWGTFCGPCIAEMGEYAKFYDDLPDNVNLVGVICDVYDGFDNNVQAAHDILSENGAGFMNLKTSESVYGFTAGFQYVPSSFFVDSEGHIIGEMMDGAGFRETEARLNEYIR